MGHEEFGTGAVRGAGARIQAGEDADFLPQIKLLGQGFQGGQAAEGGLFLGRDELEADLGEAFGDERHGAWTHRAIPCSKPARKTSPAPAFAEAIPKVCSCR